MRTPDHSVPGRESRCAPLVRAERVEHVRLLVDEEPSGSAKPAIEWLLELVDGVLPAIDRCLVEADAVLAGSQSAANRLWLILKTARIPLVEPLPAALLDDIAPSASREVTYAIDDKRLLDLVMGTLYAANQPVEAERMVNALHGLLGPLFGLEYAYHALQAGTEGRCSPLQTLLTWLNAGREKSVEYHTRGGSGEIGWEDRVDFDLGSWRDSHHSNLHQWPIYSKCLGQSHTYMSQRDLFGAPYQIDRLSDPHACPGHHLLIHGQNFGTSGRVYFPTPDLDDPTAGTAVSAGIDAVSWTDTVIDVIVPPWARPGDLHLNAFRRVADPCVTKDIYRRGNTIPFIGGLPIISEIRVNGRSQGAWAEPGATAIIAWTTSTGMVTVDVRNEEDPSEAHVYSSDRSGFGTMPWVPNAAIVKPTRYIVALTVTNACGSVTREAPVIVTIAPTLKIEGIEVTQGIQTFRISLDAPRNTLTTVADKDTIVRVYVSASRKGFLGDVFAGVTGLLTVDGVKLSPINGAAPGQGFGNPRIDVGPAKLIRRATTDASLNFRIPAPLCKGTRTLAVTVFGKDETKELRSASQSIPWTWLSRPPLRVRYVRVSYMGAQPTVEEARQTVLRALDLLPFPATDVGPAAVSEWNTGQDLSTDDGREELLDHLSDQHNCTLSEAIFPWEDDCPDDDGALWLAVVKASVSGRARIRASTALAPTVNFNRTSAAHELGHLLCLRHVVRGCRSNWPAASTTCGGWFTRKGYDTLPKDGLIMEVPFEPHFNEAIDWTASDEDGFLWDFMSYACRRWISPFNWEKLATSIYATGGG